MKKLVATFIFAVITLVSFGQFNKGTWMVGGSVSAVFQADKNKNGSTTTVTDHYNSVDIYPQAGFFVIDNLAVGAGIDMFTSTYKETGGNYKSASHSVSLSPFVRYYYQKFYGQGTFSVGSGKTKTTNDGTETTSTYNQGGWSLGVGYAYLLNESVAVEPQIGYQSNSQKYSSTDKDINSGLFIRVGFQIYLRKL